MRVKERLLVERCVLDAVGKVIEEYVEEERLTSEEAEHLRIMAHDIGNEVVDELGKWFAFDGEVNDD